MNNRTYSILTGRDSFDTLKKIGDLFSLHKGIITDFNNFKVSAKKSNIDLQVCSTYRDFKKQEHIWNQKALGKRKLFNRAGDSLCHDQLSKHQLLESILTWSAIPGASRHHWGSDFDIFDQNIKSKEEVNLTPKECSTDFKSLYSWIDSNISDSPFFRPYINDLGGVSIEPWHLSHREVSQSLNELYTIDIFIRNIEESNIELKELILENPEYFFTKYVKNISM